MDYLQRIRSGYCALSCAFTREARSRRKSRWHILSQGNSLFDFRFGWGGGVGCKGLLCRTYRRNDIKQKVHCSNRLCFCVYIVEQVTGLEMTLYVRNSCFLRKRSKIQQQKAGFNSKPSGVVLEWLKEKIPHWLWTLKTIICCVPTWSRRRESR